MNRRGMLMGGLGTALAAPAVRADPWIADASVSSVRMEIQALGVRQAGVFRRWGADIDFDPARLERARAVIVVQARSLEMRTRSLTPRAQGVDFLDVDRHPQIRFELTSLRPRSLGRFTAMADVTVRGRTQRVTFSADLRITGDTAQMTGGFALDRAALDIGTNGPWNAVIGRQVRIDVSLATRRAG